MRLRFKIYHAIMGAIFLYLFAKTIWVFAIGSPCTSSAFLILLINLNVWVSTTIILQKSKDYWK